MLQRQFTGTVSLLCSVYGLGNSPETLEQMMYDVKKNIWAKDKKGSWAQ